MNYKKVALDYGSIITTFITSFLVISILTFLSWLVAFAYDESTINEVYGKLGHYAFTVLRFPSHNYFWSDRRFVMDHYFALLLMNIFLYSLLSTTVITIWRRRKAKLN